MAAQQEVDVSSGLDDGTTLWIEIGTDVERDASCPLAGTTDPTTSGSVQLVGETCHLLLRSDHTGGETVRTYTTPVTEDCVCLSFCHPGCVTEVLAVENGSLKIGAYAESRETLVEVMEDVREKAAAVRLERLTTGDTTDEEKSPRPDTVDDVSLTEKQREAVQTAVEMGYYQTPRNASLDDLADRVGVSKSAFSQRLNAVETKLVTALVSSL
ncbi:MAG: helix-turn-helix domain-containing protein [Halanaeroarchaeum sp.]